MAILFMEQKRIVFIELIQSFLLGYKTKLLGEVHMDAVSEQNKSSESHFFFHKG